MQLLLKLEINYLYIKLEKKIINCTIIKNMKKDTFNLSESAQAFVGFTGELLEKNEKLTVGGSKKNVAIFDSNVNGTDQMKAIDEVAVLEANKSVEYPEQQNVSILNFTQQGTDGMAAIDLEKVFDEGSAE